MQFHEWTVKVRVPGYAVAQGGTIDAETLLSALAEEIPQAHDGDIKVMIIKAPSEKAIRQEQA